MDNSLQTLLADPRIFRPRRDDGAGAGHVATGFPALDARLPGGGWPRGSLSEILSAQWGVGELRLLLPALRDLAGRGGRILWLSPPWIPYAPALAAAGLAPACNIVTWPDNVEDRVWAAEQGLRSGSCAAVLTWGCGQGRHHFRRLQLAAGAGGIPAYLFRESGAARSPSPATLRLLLAPRNEGLEVEILKSPGGRGGRVLLGP